MDYLRSQIETLIFCANSPIKAKDIQLALAEMLGTKVNLRDVKKDIAALIEKYQSEEFTFEICNLANGYQFLTKPNYQKIIEIFLGQKSRRGLSQSALETLAIVAYKQPITKSQIEAIRGMGSDYTVRKLLDKELLTIRGKAPTPGRPILYGTSAKFMHYFGINSIEDLPFPEDLEGDEEEFEEEGAELRAIEAIDVSFKVQEDKKNISDLLEEAGEELDKEEIIRKEEEKILAEEEAKKAFENAENNSEIELDEKVLEEDSPIQIEGEVKSEIEIPQIEMEEAQLENESEEEIKSEIEIPQIELEEVQLENENEEEIKSEIEIPQIETEEAQLENENDLSEENLENQTDFDLFSQNKDKPNPEEEEDSENLDAVD